MPISLVAPYPRRMELFHVSLVIHITFEIHLTAVICSEGKGRVTIFAAQSNARTFDYQVNSFRLSPIFLFWHSRPHKGWRHRYGTNPCSTASITNYFLIGYVPASMGMAMSSTSFISVLNAFVGHYVENIGNTTLKYLEIFNSGTRSTFQKNLNSIDAHSCGRNIRRYQLEQCA